MPAGAASPSELRVTGTTEYGLPWAKPAAGTTQARYGWLGTHQRDASTIGGLTSMGVRLYAGLEVSGIIGLGGVGGR